MLYVKSYFFFFRNCKTLPLKGYYMQKFAVRWHSKTFCKNKACRVGTTTGLLSPARES